MKSLRNSIGIAFISVNIIVIALISINTILGFFRINDKWEEGITEDIAAAVNYELAQYCPDLPDIAELAESELTVIVETIMKKYSGRLNSISFYSRYGKKISEIDITDIPARLSKRGFRPELIRWISSVSHRLTGLKSGNMGTLVNAQGIRIGEIQIRSFSLMGMKYTVLFDQIISGSFLLGIVSAAIFSLLISFVLSRSLSRSSRIFAGQLTKLASGDRNINFVTGSTIEMKSSAEAAEILQKQLKHGEISQLRKLQDIIHDLKTPIAALGIQFEAVRDGLLSVDDNRIGLLSMEFSRIEEIVNELSGYTKLSSEDYSPEPEIINLNDLVEETAERFLLQTESNEQHIIFNKPKIPSLIEADRIGIIRVLNNLTVNAVNNSPKEGVISLSIRSSKRIIDGRDIFIFEIENDGRISEEDLPFIFERLYRSKRPGYKGSGLGLAISKTIVEKNHGKITAWNTAVNTVVFRVELPVIWEG